LLAQTVRNATKKLKDKIDYDIIFLWTCKYLCAEFYNHIEAGDPNFRGESLIQWWVNSPTQTRQLTSQALEEEIAGKSSSVFMQKPWISHSFFALYRSFYAPLIKAHF